MKNKAYTTLELILVVAVVLFILCLAIINSYNSRKTRGVAYRMICGTNLSGIGKAMLIYANDNRGKYPTPSEWCDLLMERADLSIKKLRCKKDQENQSSYAMNPYCDPNSPNDVVLVFEANIGWNQYGGPELLDLENHDGEGCTILFNDCHVEFVYTKKIDDLKWQVDPND
ncbi:MAG: hypothetical protein ACYSTX_05900 [Planctomycetota bacterium]|jgi:hypothetical protein